MTWVDVDEALRRLSEMEPWGQSFWEFTGVWERIEVWLKELEAEGKAYAEELGRWEGEGGASGRWETWMDVAMKKS